MLRTVLLFVFIYYYKYIIFIYMKTLILAILSALLVSGCGQPPAESAGSTSSASQPATVYSLYLYYEVPLDGHIVHLQNLDTMTLMQTTSISYSVDGTQCIADAILTKPGAINLYHLQVLNMSAVVTSDPAQMALCDAGQPSNFWMRLTGQFTMIFTRSN